MTDKLMGGFVGAVLTASLFLVGLFFNGDTATRDVIGLPPAPTPPLAPAESRCPQGWKDTSTRDIDIVVPSCSRDGWLVVLNPDNSFNYGVQLDTPGASFKFSPFEVPGWPR